MKTSILIVDDEKSIRELLKKLLESEGYVCMLASGAGEAREYLEKQDVELMLCDIRMPGESGLDLVRHVTKKFPNTAILMVTAVDDPHESKTALEAGIYGYIVKPFTPNQILISVINALRRRELEMARRDHLKDLEKMIAERTSNLEETNLKFQQEIAEHKHAKKAITTSERKYRLLINHIPGFVYKGYKDWSVDFVDNKVGELTGYNKEEFDARRLKWCDLIYREDFESTKKCILDALNANGSYIREYRIKTKTGKTIWMQDRGQIIRDQTDEIDHFSGIFFDITKQKQAEEELRRNERYYRSILKHMHENIAVINQDFRITDVNTTFLTTIGCAREAIIGRNCYEVLHGYSEPCDRHGMACKLSEVFATGKPQQFLHEFTDADGSKVWLDMIISPLKDDHNKITHVIEAARDVTDQKRMEKSLLQSEEKHRLLVNNASDAIFIAQDETIKFSNPKTEKISGYSAAELFEIPLVNLIHPQDRNMVLERYEKRLKGEKLSGTYAFRILNKTGQEVWVQPKTTSIAWEGKPAALTFLRDISEIKQAEEQRKQIETQLLQSEKMASIGQLAAGVAHEINNPTGFVSSNLKTLSDYIKDISNLTKEYRNLIAGLKENTDSGGNRPDISGQMQRITTLEDEMDIDFILNDLTELIEESREGTERIKSIIQALKDFAHPGEDKPKFADINQNLDSTVNVVWNELKYKAEVIKDYGDLPEVHCYPQMLNQVFMNLLVNAAQAIEERGEIRIQTRADNGSVAVQISDTGAGIPKEQLPRIFDPFYTTKEVGKGTGLGLNVAYNIIQKHHGKMDVKSEVGKGTTFTIRLAANNELV